MESMREFSDRIADTLESGDAWWRRIEPEPGLPMRFDGQAFDGASVLSLWMTGNEKGFERPTWLGWERIDEMGGRLKAGATPGTAWLRVRSPRRLFGLVGGREDVEVWQPSEVWCVDEIDGLPDHLYRRAEEFRTPAPDPGEVRRDDWPREVLDEVLFEWGGLPEERWEDAVGNAARVLVGRGDDGEAPGWMSGLHNLRWAETGLMAEFGAAFILAEFGITTRQLEPWGWPGWAGDVVVGIRGDERVVFRATAAAAGAVEWLRCHAPGYRAFGALPAVQATWDGRMPGPVQTADEVLRMVPDQMAAFHAVSDARAVTCEALAARQQSVVAGGDSGAWRAHADDLVRKVALLDLDAPGVRAAVEAEVALAAGKPDEVVSAETFVADFREATERRLRMFDLTEGRQQTMGGGVRL